MCVAPLVCNWAGGAGGGGWGLGVQARVPAATAAAWLRRILSWPGAAPSLGALQAGCQPLRQARGWLRPGWHCPRLDVRYVLTGSVLG